MGVSTNGSVSARTRFAVALLLGTASVAFVAAAAATAHNSQQASDPPRIIESYAVLASELLWLGDGSTIESGHVGVNRATQPIWPGLPSVEAWIGREVSLDEDLALAADTVWFDATIDTVDTPV